MTVGQALGSPLQWTVPHGPGDLSIELFSPCLLRTPGFPIALLNGAGTAESLDWAAHADARIREREAEQADFLIRRWPILRAAARKGGHRHPAWRSLLRAHRLIESAQALDGAALALGEVGGAELTAWAGRWNTRIARDEAFRTETAAALEKAIIRSYRHTARAIDEERIRHAVFISNPSFFRNALERPLSDQPGLLTNELPNRGMRRNLATAHRYLRRFTTKCETVSFFGPVLFAELNPIQAETVLVRQPADERVLVEASTWLADLLSKLAAKHIPAAERRARRSPIFRELPDGDGLERVVDGKKFRVSAPALRLWRAADGTRTIGALADHLGVDQLSAEHAVRGLGTSLIVTGHPLTATELHPLALLAEHDPTGVAARIATARTEYATTPWPHRASVYTKIQQDVAAWAGSSKRGAGQHYADREIFFEDRTSPYSERVTFGGSVLDGIQHALSAVMPLCHLSALLAREDARDALRSELGDRPGLLARLATIPLRGDRPRVERLRTVMRELVSSRPTDAAGALYLTRQEIDDATAALWQLVPPTARREACLPSPDLMAIGTDLSSATWLLSELHDDCSSIYGGLENRAHSDPDGLWNDFARRIGVRVPPQEMSTIVSRRRSAHVTPELPGLSIELSGLSAKPRAETAAIADVTVPATGDVLEVRGERRHLYPGDLSSPLHRAISLPAVAPFAIETGSRTPRIVIDGVVYQRARWRTSIPSTTSRELYDRWLTVQRWRRDQGLPRHVYVRHPDEPKPLYVDFADPLAVAELTGLTPEESVITEMLPTPDQLWWQTESGYQCAEFRLGCLIHGM